MSASGPTGTLSVGVPGGPQTDIFTLNNPPLAGSLAVSTAASSQGNIIFNSSSSVYGGIGVTQPGGPFLLDLSGGNTGSVVNFMGPVFATTLNVTGTGAINFNSGSTNITATNFAADGTISLAPNTTVIGALTTTAGANTGTLVLGGGSVLTGAVGGAVGLRSINVVGGSNTAGVTASISGAVDAYAFSLGTNTLAIGGALTIANIGPSGVVNTTLASPTVYGNIRVVGATNLGPSLRINVTVPSTTFLPVGSQFNIIQTQSGTVQSGTDGSVVSVTVQAPSNPLYSFVAVPLAGTIAGLVTIRTTAIPLGVPLNPPPGVVLPPVAPIAAVIVPIIETIVNSDPPGAPPRDLVNVLGPINALTDPAAVVNAVAQLAPSTPSLAAPLVTFQAAQQFQGLLAARIGSILCRESEQRTERTPGCTGEDQRAGWWLKGFAYAGNQGAVQTSTGYHSSIFGTMIGYDVPLDPNTRAGIAMGYGRGQIDGKTFSADTSFNTYDVMAYVAQRRGAWFVNGDVAVGFNDYSSRRTIAFPGFNRTAQGKYSGQNYSASATTGYDFLSGGFTLTPLAALNYTHVNMRGFSESGAGDINLRVSSQSYDFLESSLGGKIAREYSDGNLTYVPEIHAKWLHELLNPKLGQTAAFAATGSPQFRTNGLKTANDTLNIGAGVTLLSCVCSGVTWSLEAVYDYYRRSDAYSAHQAMVKISARF